MGFPNTAGGLCTGESLAYGHSDGHPAATGHAAHLMPPVFVWRFHLGSWWIRRVSMQSDWVMNDTCAGFVE